MRILLGVLLSVVAPAFEDEPAGSTPVDRIIRMSPLNRAIDRDGDGVISAVEIDAAVEAIWSLDRNQDGVVGRIELTPQPPMLAQRDSDRSRGDGRRRETDDDASDRPELDDDDDDRMSRERGDRRLDSAGRPERRNNDRTSGSETDGKDRRPEMPRDSDQRGPDQRGPDQRGPDRDGSRDQSPFGPSRGFGFGPGFGPGPFPYGSPVPMSGPSGPFGPMSEFAGRDKSPQHSQIEASGPHRSHSAAMSAIMFRLLDTDHNGNLSAGEFQRLIDAMSESPMISSTLPPVSRRPSPRSQQAEAQAAQPQRLQGPPPRQQIRMELKASPPELKAGEQPKPDTEMKNERIRTNHRPPGIRKLPVDGGWI